MHHTETYSSSLLAGLVFCSQCGSRLTTEGSPAYKYLGRPNRRKASCAMTNRVPIDRAESAVISKLTELLTVEPGWLGAAQKRLTELDSQIGNVLRAAESGGAVCAILVDRLKTLEARRSEVEAQADAQKSIAKQPLVMPDEAWVRGQLTDSASVLRGELPRAAQLLRRLLGQITLHSIQSAGRMRG